MNRPQLKYSWTETDNVAPAGYRRLSPRESLEYRGEETAENIKKHAREIGEFCRLIAADAGKREFEVVGCYVSSLRPWLEDLLYYTQKGIQIEVDLRDLRQNERRDHFGAQQ